MVDTVEIDVTDKATLWLVTPDGWTTAVAQLPIEPQHLTKHEEYQLIIRKEGAILSWELRQDND